MGTNYSRADLETWRRKVDAMADDYERKVRPTRAELLDAIRHNAEQYQEMVRSPVRAAPPAGYLARRVGGRLVPGPGYSEHDMFMVKKVGNRTKLVKVQPRAAALVYTVESHQEAETLKQDLMRQGKTGTILVVEPSEEDKAIAEYVRRRSAAQAHIGRSR